MSAPEHVAPTTADAYRTTPEELALVLVDQSQDARDFARDQADARLTQELNEGGRFRRIVKGIWKGNIAKDYYRQKYTQEARDSIEDSQDILVHDATPEQRGRAMEATIQRFQSEYEDVIHTDAGEQRRELDQNSDISSSLKGLIRQYAEGQLNDEALLEERTRVIEAYQEANGNELLGEGIVKIDNILTVAQAVRGAVEHGESIDQVMDAMKVISGEARSGVRTEARYNKVDRAIDKLNSSKIGSLVGPEIVAASVTTVASLLRLGSHKVVGALAMTVAPGVAAGFWAGLRENKRVKDERAQHSREMAMGKEFYEGDKRREQMEATRYNSAPAQELTDILQARFGSEDGLDGDAALRAALDELSAVETRISMSDSRNIDLITYSDTAAVEEERLALDLARAQAKTILDQRLDPATRQQLGLDENAPLQQLLSEQATLFADCMERDMSERDSAFRKLKARRVATATATGVLTGLTLGVIAQEGIASLSGTRQGLVEQLWGAKDSPINGEQHQTLAYGLVHGDNSHNISVHHDPSGTYDSYNVGARGDIDLSDDHSLVHNDNGTISIVDKDGHATVDQLAVNPDGSLPQSSLDALSAQGMTVEDLSHTIDTVTTEQQTVSVGDYIDQNPGQTTHITRDLWYDNNTPAPVFDKNELGIHWADGDKGLGLQQNGDVRLSISSMTAGGSFHDGQAVDWASVAERGDIKLAISATSGTQANVFMLDIQPDGTVTVPHDSIAAQFFSEHDGQAAFEGRYAEVVQMTGQGADGTEHVRTLSTLVGEGKSDVQAPVPVHHQELVPDYKITTAGYDTAEQQSTFTEMAPVIPVIPRRSMEAVSPREPTTPERPYYNGYLSGAELARAREETSPRLRNNPDAQLNPAEELEWYKDLTRKKRGAAYVQDIEAAVASSPELSSLPPGLKAIIKIPVNAAGRSESENIYNVLGAYADQDPEALADAVILLHVNWFEDAAGDPEKQQAIERTKAEIERARADFPQLRIATIETEWNREEVKDGVIGHVGRRLNDAALFAVASAMEKGTIPGERDVVLIRNDADPKGLSRHYLKRYMEESERHPETDVFMGTTTFDNTKAAQLPGLVFSANFMQSLNLLRTAREHHVHTGGANFGIRASALAAVGSTGFDEEEYNGAGSDDVMIGRRVTAARTADPSSYTGGRGARLRTYMEVWRRKKGRKYYGAGDAASSSRRVGRLVAGARIDTDSDREEELYRDGVPIVHTWDGGKFDANAYTDRDAGLRGREAMSENLATNPDEVINRVEHDMEGSINHMGVSDAVIRSALAMTFVKLGSEASSAYRLTRNTQGSYKLTLTDTGRQYLVNHLTRDSKGRFDTYGSRKLRQMYGEAKQSAKRQPQRQPMIKV